MHTNKDMEMQEIKRNTNQAAAGPSNAASNGSTKMTTNGKKGDGNKQNGSAEGEHGSGRPKQLPKLDMKHRQGIAEKRMVFVIMHSQCQISIRENMEPSIKKYIQDEIAKVFGTVIAEYGKEMKRHPNCSCQEMEKFLKERILSELQVALIKLLQITHHIKSSQDRDGFALITRITGDILADNMQFLMDSIVEIVQILYLGEEKPERNPGEGCKCMRTTIPYSITNVTPLVRRDSRVRRCKAYCRKNAYIYVPMLVVLAVAFVLMGVLFMNRGEQKQEFVFYPIPHEEHLPPGLDNIEINLKPINIITARNDTATVTNTTVINLAPNNMTNARYDIDTDTNMTEFNLDPDNMTTALYDVDTDTNMTELNLDPANMTIALYDVDTDTNMTELNLDPDNMTIALYDVVTDTNMTELNLAPDNMATARNDTDTNMATVHNGTDTVTNMTEVNLAPEMPIGRSDTYTNMTTVHNGTDTVTNMTEVNLAPEMPIGRSDTDTNMTTVHNGTAIVTNMTEVNLAPEMPIGRSDTYTNMTTVHNGTDTVTNMTEVNLAPEMPIGRNDTDAVTFMTPNNMTTVDNVTSTNNTSDKMENFL